MNFAGIRAYPINSDESPAIARAGAVEKHAPTGLPRGGTGADYNVKLRALGQRVDEKPERPY